MRIATEYVQKPFSTNLKFLKNLKPNTSNGHYFETKHNFHVSFVFFQWYVYKLLTIVKSRYWDNYTCINNERPRKKLWSFRTFEFKKALLNILLLLLIVCRIKKIYSKSRFP